MCLALSSAAAWQGGGGVLDAVVFLEAALEPLEDVNGLGHAGFDHIHLLEAPRQGRVFLEDAPVLGEGGRADAFERAELSARLEQVGSIQRAARGRPAPMRVWISSMNRMALGLS